jgi:hypothetical protein
MCCTKELESWNALVPTGESLQFAKIILKTGGKQEGLLVVRLFGDLFCPKPLCPHWE